MRYLGAIKAREIVKQAKQSILSLSPKSGSKRRRSNEQSHDALEKAIEKGEGQTEAKKRDSGGKGENRRLNRARLH